MKTKHLYLLLCALFLFFGATQLNAQDKKKSKETVKFLVEEMHCKNCQNKIEKNVGFEKGVTDIQCDLDKKTVEVTYKTDKTSPEQIIKGFEKIGYSVKVVDGKKSDNTDK